jgi:hypothetical protein
MERPLRGTDDYDVGVPSTEIASAAMAFDGEEGHIGDAAQFWGCDNGLD